MGALFIRHLDGKTPSGPPLISAGALIAHPDRIFIYAPPRVSKKQRHISSVESMTLELPCARGGFVAYFEVHRERTFCKNRNAILHSSRREFKL